MDLKTLTICLGGLAALAAAGCSGKTQQCTPSTSECAGERAVLVCPSDGSAWSTYTCEAWETCNSGACQAIDGIEVECTPGTAKCVNDRVLSVCVAAGIAPSILSCLENETCTDGACQANAACTAGATECVGDSLMRTCAADGKTWVARACGANEACSPATGACVRRTDIACTAADNGCVDGVPFVCKRDGTGYDTTPCPANTHCVEDGRCQGNAATGCVVGSSCSGDTVVSCSSDGKTRTYTQCAVGHSCVVDPATRVASCKQIVCPPGARQCGNPADPTADLGLFVSTCKPDGSGWAVARCEAGSVCNGGACEFDCLPGETACSLNSIVTCGAQGKWDLASVDSCDEYTVCVDPAEGPARCDHVLCVLTAGAGSCLDSFHHSGCKGGVLQPAVYCPGGCIGTECHGGCMDGETLCVGSGVVTCTSGQWPGADQALDCNGAAAAGAAPKTCVQLSDLPGAIKAVCGDPECAHIGQRCMPDGRIQKCEEGVLGPVEDCPAGTTCSSAHLGCWAPECAAGETVCVDESDGPGYRTCEDGRWSQTYLSCGQTAQGALTICRATFDASGARSHQCQDPQGCSPGARQCSADGLGVETCLADGTWGAASACAMGRCFGSDATCTVECKPGETVCGGPSVTVLGQSAHTKTGTCSSSGRLPDWNSIPDCPTDTFCRQDAFGTALGCVECVGTRLANGYVDTRCALDPDGFQVEFCGPSNTWASSTAASIDCGAGACALPSAALPARCVGSP